MEAGPRRFASTQCGYRLQGRRFGSVEEVEIINIAWVLRREDLEVLEASKKQPRTAESSATAGFCPKHDCEPLLRVLSRSPCVLAPWPRVVVQPVYISIEQARLTPSK